MENAELDVALEELENRLERLRALYEQYFMGIERIEPQIPRKDIDRRIYVLRREKIRNTAKRFKLQTIISRYNTFQQYWQRICREIENGTYKRHVIRAERIAPGALLTIAARKRLGRHVFDDGEAEPSPQAAVPGSAPPPAAASSPPPASSRPAAPSAPHPAPPALAAAGKAAPPPKPVPPPKPGARPEKAAPPPAAATRSFESLDLDMDFMGDWDPTGAAVKSSPGGRAPMVPARPFGEALARPLGAAPIASASTSNPLKGMPPRAPPAAPSGAAGAGVPQAAAPRAAAPQAAALPSAVGPQKPLPVTAAAKPPIASPATPAAKPATPVSAAIPPAAKLGAAPIAKPAPAKPAARAAAALTDERVRELHARLVEAKRQTKDTGAVSVEGLAKSLKATEAKLREQHKNRKIDFDVIIKDGKAILKPTVR